MRQEKKVRFRDNKNKDKRVSDKEAIRDIEKADRVRDKERQREEKGREKKKS